MHDMRYNVCASKNTAPTLKHHEESQTVRPARGRAVPFNNIHQGYACFSGQAFCPEADLDNLAAADNAALYEPAQVTFRGVQPQACRDLKVGSNTLYKLIVI